MVLRLLGERTPARSLVGNLLALRRPPAVAGLVVAVVVGVAIDGMRWRGLAAHVGQERFETLSPALADLDPASAVPGPMSTARVLAAGDHLDPRPVFGTPPTIPRLAMGEVALAAHLQKETATRAGMTGTQSPAHHADGLAAIATAHPPVLQPIAGTRGLGAVQHDQATEPLASQIQEHAAILRAAAPVRVRVSPRKRGYLYGQG